MRAYFATLRDLGERELYRVHDPLARREGREWFGSLEEVAQTIASCRRCGLHATRTTTVPGAGNPFSGIVMVGEAPGEQEDLRGLPFVGPSGLLLRRLFHMAGLAEDTYFLLNVLKCRPPGNRDPQEEEMEACAVFLSAQLRLLAPRLIICLGRYAAWRVLGNPEVALRVMREGVHEREGALVVVTYHPSALLHKPELRAEAWRDIKKARRLADRLGLPHRRACS